MDLGSKKRIAVLAGGYSGEAVISLQSAATVLENLDTDLFEPVLVRIDPESWWVVDEKNGNPAIDKSDFTFSSSEGKKISFDAIFIMVHGTPGEDGKLQGYLDMVGIPYNTSSAAIMALTFQKFHCNKFLKNFAINVPKSILIKPREATSESKIIERVKLPCFVKPTNGGSSFGVTKVK